MIVGFVYWYLWQQTSHPFEEIHIDFRPGFTGLHVCLLLCEKCFRPGTPKAKRLI